VVVVVVGFWLGRWGEGWFFGAWLFFLGGLQQSGGLFFPSPLARGLAPLFGVFLFWLGVCRKVAVTPFPLFMRFTARFSF